MQFSYSRSIFWKHISWQVLKMAFQSLQILLLLGEDTPISPYKARACMFGTRDNAPTPVTKNLPTALAWVCLARKVVTLQMNPLSWRSVVTFNDNKYALLTRRFFAFLLTEAKSRSKSKKTRPISTYLDRTMTELYHMAKNKYFIFGTNAGNPGRARWAHHALSGSQSECSIRFILADRGFSHIIYNNR